MRASNRWVPITSLVVGLLLILSACGGTDVTEGAPSGGEDSSNGDQTTSEDPQTLAEFFGYGDEDFDVAAQQAEDRARQLEVEEKTAACMAEQGFEYTPYVPEEMFVYYAGPEEDLTEEERMKTYGYGYFTYMLEEAQNQDVIQEEFDPNDDPNWARMEAMSESERAAYEKALYGDWESFDSEPQYDEDGNQIYVEPDFSEIGGCANLAQEEVWGRGQEFNDEMMALQEQLEPLWMDLYARIEADPRMVDANAEWAACMADRGYTFAKQDDIYEYLSKKQEDLWSNQEGFSSGEATATTISEGGGDFGPFGPGIDEAMIQGLADEELAIASDDWDCQGGKSFNDLRQEVSEEYEAEFIAGNRDLLEQQKALMEGAGF
jgi:hypothetical protein